MKELATMGTDEAFQRFPFEVWEGILEEVKCPIDIDHVFQAYPELQREGVLNRQRHLWLFAQVLPLIFPRLKQQQLLACRQVCKTWCRGVDNFLENHPSQRAYSQGKEVIGQYRILRASPSYYILRKYWAGVKVFSGTESFNAFLLDVGGHPPDRNPFLGRSVTVNDYWKEIGYEWPPVAAPPFCWETCMNFLSIFGSHIWFLTVDSNEAIPAQFTQVILQSLTLLPNLKSLKIVFGYDHGSRSIQDILEPLTGRAPPLPQLETLDVSDTFLPSPLVSFLIMSYSNQLRRLSIHHCHWRKEYSELFPNLTEFSLWGATTNDQVLEIIHSFKASLLYGLELLPSSNYSDHFYKLLQKVLKLLPQFPNITGLVIIDPCKRHRMKSKCDPDEIRKSQNTRRWKWKYRNEKSSLRSLIIYTLDDLHLNRKLFRFLPHLEYLKIKATSAHPGMYDNDYISLKQRREWKDIAHCADFWGVWLPKLKTVTIAHYQPQDCNCHFIPRRKVYDRNSHDAYDQLTRPTSISNLSRLVDDEWFDSMHELSEEDEEDEEENDDDRRIRQLYHYTIHGAYICSPYEHFR